MMCPGNERIVAQRLHELLAKAAGTKLSTDTTPPASQIAGEWQVDIEFTASRTTHVLYLQQNGSDIVGSHEGDFLTRDLLGSMQGDAVTLTSSIGEQHGAAVSYTFSGTVRDGKMSGDLNWASIGRPNGRLRPEKSISGARAAPEQALRNDAPEYMLNGLFTLLMTGFRPQLARFCFLGPVLIFALAPAFSQVQGSAASDSNITVGSEMVPMRDGVRLATDIYRPARDGSPVSDKFPVILERTPYNKNHLAAAANRYVPHGYIVIAQDVRGRYKSEGRWDPIRDDPNDGFDTAQVDRRSQPWSDGGIGTMGTSYAGATQHAHGHRQCSLSQGDGAAQCDVGFRPIRRSPQRRIRAAFFQLGVYARQSPPATPNAAAAAMRAAQRSGSRPGSGRHGHCTCASMCAACRCALARLRSNSRPITKHG